MKVLYTCCCGLDVHRSIITANLLRKGSRGKKKLDEVRKFGAMTKDLLELSDWLKSAGCTHIAMESTGVFWKPIFNVLGSDFEVILVNARHVKALPGRKTDIKDCQWLAQLLQHGLLRASFIPSQPIRELRDLTRQRRCLVNEKTRAVNRIHKILQDANIKLSSVISDIMGKSGLLIIKDIISGQTDATVLAQHAHGRMKSKIDDLVLALQGKITDHHRFMLSKHMKQIEFLEEMIFDFDKKIDEKIKSEGEDFFVLIPLLSTIPGVDIRSSQELIAEIGVDMNQFPNEDHLSSWAGVSPGNNESAGKRKSGKTTKGSPWLKAALGEMAWCAARTKNTYLSAQYKRIAKRRGKKRAIIAVGHTMLVIAYHIIKNRIEYKDLGSDHFDKFNKKKMENSLVKKLEKLGYKVVLEKDNKVA